MGGDRAPVPTVAGAVAASRNDLHVLLVGDEAVLREESAKRGGLPPTVHVHHAPEVVDMEDGARNALRRKKNSSLRLSFELVRNGQADAVVTMGNTGAALAMGMFVCNRLEGVLRPAVTVLFPSRAGPVALLDVGANVECKPEQLAQFGVMGTVLARVLLGKGQPRVGLLSNGKEESKGTELTREAAALLHDRPGLDFVGYLEPAQLMDGTADVMVTDGWTGNILLKTAEGVARQAKRLLAEASEASPRARAGGFLLQPELHERMGTLDSQKHGGGLLLGIDACAVIGHGSADPKTVASAIERAAQLVHGGLVDRLRHAFAEQGVSEALSGPQSCPNLPAAEVAAPDDSDGASVDS